MGLHHVERIPRIEAARVQRAAGLSFRPLGALNFSNSPHSRGHVPMNHSDTFLRSSSRLQQPRQTTGRDHCTPLCPRSRSLPFHRGSPVAPIYYVSQIAREFFFPPLLNCFQSLESSVFVPTIGQRSFIRVEMSLLCFASRNRL